MRTVFADTAYWVAMLNPEDGWSGAAVKATGDLGEAHLVTTHEVLAETLNFFSRGGKAVRRHVADAVREILTAENVTVLDTSPESFLDGLEMYERRGATTLTDCVSICTMREEGLTEVLTNDEGFARAGLSIVGAETAKPAGE